MSKEDGETFFFKVLKGMFPFHFFNLCPFNRSQFHPTAILIETNLEETIMFLQFIIQTFYIVIYCPYFHIETYQLSRVFFSKFCHIPNLYPK